MAKRGREPIEDVPQKDLPPEQRNSRLYSFRVNRASGDANDVLIRQICDAWVNEGIFTEMIKKGVLLSNNSEPLTNQELSRWVIGIGKEQDNRLQVLEEHIRQLKHLVQYLTTQQPITSQQIQEGTGTEFPDGFLDTLLNNFDE